MPALLIYLFKVNMALVLFCLGYYGLLRRLTFYSINRVYLISAILFSSAYPLIDVNSFVTRHQQIARPVQAMALNINVDDLKQVTATTSINYWQFVVLAFWAGAVLMAVRLGIQLVSLYRLRQRSAPGSVLGEPVRVITEPANPFSFWQTIYINPAHHSSQDLKSIMEHEKIHVKEWHTLDILLAELSLICYWFNPGVWMIKKAISENIEFITDRKILRMGTDPKAYQYSLVTTGLTTSPNVLVNHFNIATIKKRIIMMNAKRSSGVCLLRYSLVLLAVIVTVFSFSLTKAGTRKIEVLKSAIANIKAQLPEISLYKQPSVSGDTVRIKKAKAKVAILKDTLKISDKLFKLSLRNGAIDSGEIIIDGKRGNMKDVDPQNIESIEVFQGENAKKVTAQTEGLENYNSKAGIVVVTTKSMSPGQLFHKKLEDAGLVKPTPVVRPDLKSIFEVDRKQPDTLAKGQFAKRVPEIIKDNSGPDKPLFIIDSKEVESIDNLDPATIYSFAVLKDKSAKALYGDKGKNGVIVVTTKKK